ncbi:hypothetical protein BB559_005776 [Furculomyces boomerangus]|uniref:Uncharacterized protein n=1 Tax=Furculomyces boomerangus TaxID=61424 RepID=A0A2T9Y6R2_9FUNG|nr:hypothetical protein BB559_005776 [Furculomyces boomerangus]
MMSFSSGKTNSSLDINKENPAQKSDMETKTPSSAVRTENDTEDLLNPDKKNLVDIIVSELNTFKTSTVKRVLSKKHYPKKSNLKARPQITLIKNTDNNPTQTDIESSVSKGLLTPIITNKSNREYIHNAIPRNTLQYFMVDLVLLKSFIAFSTYRDIKNHSNHFDSNNTKAYLGSCLSEYELCSKMAISLYPDFEDSWLGRTLDHLYRKLSDDDIPEKAVPLQKFISKIFLKESSEKDGGVPIKPYYSYGMGYGSENNEENFVLPLLYGHEMLFVESLKRIIEIDDI